LALTSVLVEEAPDGSGRNEPREAPVTTPAFGGWGSQQASPLEFGKSRGLISALGRRGGHQLGDYLSSVGDLNALAGANQAQVLAEPIFQLAQPDLLHGPNVALHTATLSMLAL
jgi:hypothetical protein